MHGLEKIKHISVEKGMSVSELVKRMGQSGVMGGGRIAKATRILQEMLNDKECTVFMGVAGAMVPGGMKNIIINLIRQKKIHVLVTTGATLTHDLVEALGYNHYQGMAHANDAELHKKGIDRMYDSYMPNKVYEGMEKFFQEHWEEFAKQKTIKELLKSIGSFVTKEHCDSILRACYEENVELFCPALADSGIGLMIWGRLASGKKIDVNAFEDMKDIIRISWDAKKKGVFYVGGGVPKNFIQQSMQFSSQAEYGVQITTDMPQWGGSSGAEMREGISWGKMKPEGKFVDVYCDATIALPLIIGALE